MGMKLDPETMRRILEQSGQSSGTLDTSSISEKQWQETVIAEAKRNGWLVYHTHDSRKSEAGFPDLVLVRDRVLFVELKTDKGVRTAAQNKWLYALGEANAQVHVWRPMDWKLIVEVLK